MTWRFAEWYMFADRMFVFLNSNDTRERVHEESQAFPSRYKYPEMIVIFY